MTWLIPNGCLRFQGANTESRKGADSSNHGGLSGIWKVIYRELEPGVRNPEGVWGWVWGRDLETMGRHLTNRDGYNYFKECSIVKSHKLGGVIEKH